MKPYTIVHGFQPETEKLFTETGSIRFWLKSMDYSKTFDQILYTPITTHWKVLRS